MSRKRRPSGSMLDGFDETMDIDDEIDELQRQRGEDNDPDNPNGQPVGSYLRCQTSRPTAEGTLAVGQLGLITLNKPAEIDKSRIQCLGCNKHYPGQESLLHHLRNTEECGRDVIEYMDTNKNRCKKCNKVINKPNPQSIHILILIAHVKNCNERRRGDRRPPPARGNSWENNNNSRDTYIKKETNDRNESSLVSCPICHQAFMGDAAETANEMMQHIVKNEYNCATEQSKVFKTGKCPKCSKLWGPTEKSFNIQLLHFVKCNGNPPPPPPAPRMPNHEFEVIMIDDDDDDDVQPAPPLAPPVPPPPPMVHTNGSGSPGSLIDVLSSSFTKKDWSSTPISNIPVNNNSFGDSDCPMSPFEEEESERYCGQTPNRSIPIATPTQEEIDPDYLVLDYDHDITPTSDSENFKIPVVENNLRDYRHGENRIAPRNQTPPPMETPLPTLELQGGPNFHTPNRVSSYPVNQMGPSAGTSRYTPTPPAPKQAPAPPVLSKEIRPSPKTTTTVTFPPSTPRNETPSFLTSTPNNNNKEMGPPARPLSRSNDSPGPSNRSRPSPIPTPPPSLPPFINIPRIGVTNGNSSQQGIDWDAQSMVSAVSSLQSAPDLDFHHPDEDEFQRKRVNKELNLDDITKFYKRCGNCSKTFTRMLEGLEHFREEHNQIRCPACMKFFTSETEYKDHLHQEHFKPSKSSGRIVETLRCKFCGPNGERIRYTKLWEHISDVHAKQNVPEIPPPSATFIFGDPSLLDDSGSSEDPSLGSSKKFFNPHELGVLRKVFLLDPNRPWKDRVENVAKGLRVDIARVERWFANTYRSFDTGKYPGWALIKEQGKKVLIYDVVKLPGDKLQIRVKEKFKSLMETSNNSSGLERRESEELEDGEISESEDSPVAPVPETPKDTNRSRRRSKSNSRDNDRNGIETRENENRPNVPRGRARIESEESEDEESSRREELPPKVFPPYTKQELMSDDSDTESCMTAVMPNGRASTPPLPPRIPPPQVPQTQPLPNVRVQHTPPQTPVRIPPPILKTPSRDPEIVSERRRSGHDSSNSSGSSKENSSSRSYRDSRRSKSRESRKSAEDTRNWDLSQQGSSKDIREPSRSSAGRERERRSDSSPRSRNSRSKSQNRSTSKRPRKSKYADDEDSSSDYAPSKRSRSSRSKSKSKSRAKSTDRERSKSKTRGKSKSREPERGKSREKSKSREPARGKIREKSKSREPARGKSREKSREPERAKSRGKSMEKSIPSPSTSRNCDKRQNNGRNDEYEPPEKRKRSSSSSNKDGQQQEEYTVVATTPNKIVLRRGSRPPQEPEEPEEPEIHPNVQLVSILKERLKEIEEKLKKMNSRADYTKLLEEAQKCNKELNDLMREEDPEISANLSKLVNASQKIIDGIKTRLEPAKKSFEGRIPKKVPSNNDRNGPSGNAASSSSKAPAKKPTKPDVQPIVNSPALQKLDALLRQGQADKDAKEKQAAALKSITNSNYQENNLGWDPEENLEEPSTLQNSVPVSTLQNSVPVSPPEPPNPPPSSTNSSRMLQNPPNYGRSPLENQHQNEFERESGYAQAFQRRDDFNNDRGNFRGRNGNNRGFNRGNHNNRGRGNHMENGGGWGNNGDRGWGNNDRGGSNYNNRRGNNNNRRGNNNNRGWSNRGDRGGNNNYGRGGNNNNRGGNNSDRGGNNNSNNERFWGRTPENLAEDENWDDAPATSSNNFQRREDRTNFGGNSNNFGRSANNLAEDEDWDAPAITNITFQRREDLNNHPGPSVPREGNSNQVRNNNSEFREPAPPYENASQRGRSNSGDGNNSNSRGNPNLQDRPEEFLPDPRIARTRNNSNIQENHPNPTPMEISNPVGNSSDLNQANEDLDESENTSGSLFEYGHCSASPLHIIPQSPRSTIPTVVNGIQISTPLRETPGNSNPPPVYQNVLNAAPVSQMNQNPVNIIPTVSQNPVNIIPTVSQNPGNVIPQQHHNDLFSPSPPGENAAMSPNDNPITGPPPGYNSPRKLLRSPNGKNDDSQGCKKRQSDIGKLSRRELSTHLRNSKPYIERLQTQFFSSISEVSLGVVQQTKFLISFLNSRKSFKDDQRSYIDEMLDGDKSYRNEFARGKNFKKDILRYWVLIFIYAKHFNMPVHEAAWDFVSVNEFQKSRNKDHLPNPDVIKRIFLP